MIHADFTARFVLKFLFPPILTLKSQVPLRMHLISSMPMSLLAGVKTFSSNDLDISMCIL